MVHTYIEFTNKEKVNEFQAIMNAHLDGIYCTSIVKPMKHLDDDKWLIDSDLIISTVGKSYTSQRTTEIKNFESENEEASFVEDINLIASGYIAEEEEEQ